MPAAATPSMMQAIWLVGSTVFFETLRRKDFYVLVIFALAYVVGMLIAAMVGIEEPATLLFLYNLGISFAWIAAHFVALLTAARQLPSDLENRTLYPILAKPLSRFHYLLGRWLATIVSSAAVFTTLFALSWLTWICCPNRPEVSGALLLQALLLVPFSLALIAAIGLLFSLLMPMGMNAVLGGLLLLTGSLVSGFTDAGASGSPIRSVSGWLAHYIPNFEKLNLLNRYTNGIGPVDFPTFAGLLFHTFILIGAALAISSVLFERKPI